MTMHSIVLIGPPGSGKSTVGRSLSKRLERKFVDTDSLIEERTQKKISEIFVDDGEDAFRSLEIKVLKDPDAENDASGDNFSWDLLSFDQK